jgi:hypothetical protein
MKKNIDNKIKNSKLYKDINSSRESEYIKDSQIYKNITKAYGIEQHAGMYPYTVKTSSFLPSFLKESTIGQAKIVNKLPMRYIIIVKFLIKNSVKK